MKKLTSPFSINQRQRLYSHNFDGYIMMHFLMPNGQIIVLECGVSMSFESIKEILFNEATKFPFYNLLKEPKFYKFLYVTIHSTLQMIELAEESTKKLINLRNLFKPVFKLVTAAKEDVEKIVQTRIEQIINRESAVINKNSTAEERVFIQKYRTIVERLAIKRDSEPWEKRLPFAYPPDIDDEPDLPEYIKKYLNELKELIVEYVVDENSSFQIKCLALDTPKDFITKIASTLKSKNYGIFIPDEYVLKVIGQQLYFIKEYDHKRDELIEYPMIRYKYIRDCLSNYVIPRVRLEKKSNIKLDYSPVTESEKPKLPKKQLGKVMIHLWDLDPYETFKIYIGSVSSQSLADRHYAIEAGVYLAKQLIGNVVITDVKIGPNPNWNQLLDFGVLLINVPRMARICFCLISFHKSSKKNPDPIGWLNIPIFDHEGFMTQSKSDSSSLQKFSMRPYDSANESVHLNPLGTVARYTGKENKINLTMKINQHSHRIRFPLFQEYISFSKDIEETFRNFQGSFDATGKKLLNILRINPLIPLTNEQQVYIWKNWYYCKMHVPEMLPKLLRCVKWDSREQVAVAMRILKTWELIPFKYALELLDFSFFDSDVRTYAVKCLESMTNLDVECYLLQLVQALKFETYLDCALSQFLITRAIRNRRIAHYLFWNLKSEMFNPEVTNRFGLIIEIICRGDYSYSGQLLKQVEFLDRLEYLSSSMQSFGNLDTEDFVASGSFSEIINNLINPLDPRFEMRSLIAEKCDVKESKKKPIVLVFNNADPMGNCIKILFKYGDDLRQDILTLQTIDVMNRMWRTSGYDLKLVPYKVLSSGFNVGIIEMVDDSITLGKIQQQKGFKRTTIYEWLSEQKTKSMPIERQLDMFRQSCSAYSVVTLVLGIGDRHNDNVMLKTSGQMFHIDFGHFLGNYKSFLGIRRERVPFILTKDFIYTATHGNDEVTSSKFRNFQSLCEDIYMALRKHGNLLITLFALMVNSNLPELNNPDDIKFIVNTLCLNKKDEEAINYFRDRFKESYNLRWTTYLNFYAHNKRVGGNQGSGQKANEKLIAEFNIATLKKNESSNHLS